MIKYKTIGRLFVSLWVGGLILLFVLIFINREAKQLTENSNKYIIVVVPPVSIPTVTYQKLINNDGFQGDSTTRSNKDSIK